jgi:CelD/BcsL family acetyltransferase involved in cellulose biosynthesis
MRCKLITSTDELEQLEPVWDSLLGRSAADCGFLTWTWLFHWWKAFGENRDLYTVILEEDGRVVGIAPSYRDGRRLRLLGSEAVGSDYLDVIFERDREEACTEALFGFLEDRDDWDALALEDVEAGAATLDRVRSESSKRGYNLIHFETSECPFARLAPSFDEYLSELSSSRRYDIRRKLRKAAKKGEVTFEMVESADDLDGAVTAFADLNRERLGNKQIEGGFRDARFGEFHTGIMPALQRKGALRLCFLKIDGKTIASLYILKHGKKYLYYQGGFDAEWNAFSPGTLIFANAIRHGIENEGIEEFDFLRGAEGYKLGWTHDRRMLTTTEIFRPTSRGRLLYRWTRARRAARKAAKSTKEAIRKSTLFRNAFRNDQPRTSSNEPRPKYRAWSQWMPANQ